VRIQHIQIKNFRCFEDVSLNIEKPIVLISGENGSGKSSLLEAIHYGCYLRSFRTHLPKELIHFDADNFYIKMHMQSNDQLDYNLQIGFSGKKRLVKIDEKAITSYKDLAHLYRIITITEDDLSIIKGGPEVRRLFIDQAVSLQFPEFIMHLKKYRHILDNRNAFLDKGLCGHEMFTIWTQQLWEQSSLIQKYRIGLLEELQNRTNILLSNWFNESIVIRLDYQQKKMKETSFDLFMDASYDLFLLEQRYKRSLFGSHLDDISIEFCHKTSRSFASRGQQKLILMLLKIAQMQTILHHNGSAIFLLDDFMTDFDPIKSKILIGILQSLKSQLFFTSPSAQGPFEDFLLTQDTQHIKLTM